MAGAVGEATTAVGDAGGIVDVGTISCTVGVGGISAGVDIAVAWGAAGAAVGATGAGEVELQAVTRPTVTSARETSICRRVIVAPFSQPS